MQCDFLPIFDMSDMRLCAILRDSECVMLPHTGSMVTSVAWNDQSNILAGMQDGRFTVWYHPTVVYTDKDLLYGTIVRREGR